MAQKKRNIARLVLQGISIIGILLGLGCFCCVIAMFFSSQRDNLTIVGSLIISGAGFLLGAYLVYSSYLMLRGRAFGLIKSISALLALMFFSLVDPLTEFIRTKLVSGNTTRIIESIIGFAFLLSIFLVYSICVKLLERLLEVAYGPKKISDTQHSTDKQ